MKRSRLRKTKKKKKKTHETHELYVKKWNKYVSLLKKNKRVLPKFGLEKCYGQK